MDTEVIKLTWTLLCISTPYITVKHHTKLVFILLYKDIIILFMLSIIISLSSKVVFVYSLHLLMIFARHETLRKYIFTSVVNNNKIHCVTYRIKTSRIYAQGTDDNKLTVLRNTWSYQSKIMYLYIYMICNNHCDSGATITAEDDALLKISVTALNVTYNVLKTDTFWN